MKTHQQQRVRLAQRVGESLTENAQVEATGGWANLNEAQTRALARAAVGRHVVDLGAGELSLSRFMLRAGAARVTAVDSAGFPSRAVRDARLVLQTCCFAKFTPPADASTALLSWPACMVLPELLQLLTSFPSVVLISKSTDYVACGWPGLYEYFAKRPIVEYHAARRNTLIVYGAGSVIRPIRPEERAGASIWTAAALRYHELGEPDEPA